MPLTEQWVKSIPAAERYEWDDGIAAFGYSVAYDGTRVVIGAREKYHNPSGKYCGAVFVLGTDGSTVQTIYPEAADRLDSVYFGHSVAISGDWLVVGLEGADVVYFYEWTGASYTYRQRLTGSTTVATDDFGYTVTIEGTIAVVGSPWDDDNGVNSGTVWVFRLAAGTWAEDQKIVAPTTKNNQHFGSSVSVSSGVLVISAPYFDNVISDEGKGYVYEDTGTFGLVATLDNPDPVGPHARFGESVVTDGTRVFVGWLYGEGPGLTGDGAVVVYDKSGGPWAQIQKIEGPASATANAIFGASMSLSNNYLAVGAPLWEEILIPGMAGAGFVYEYSGGSYSLLWTAYPGEVGRYGWYPHGIAISGAEVALGGYLADEPDLPNIAGEPGVVRFYSFPPPAPAPVVVVAYDFNHSFNIPQIDVVRSNLPPKQIVNQFDEHGLIAGVRRNIGEKNWSYRRRIYDAWVNIANSSYRGLVNGVTRELGLELYKAATINPKKRYNSEEFHAADPYIKLDGSYLYLYSDYTNSVLDHQIDRFTTGGNYEKLGWLIDFINSTTYFEAYLHADISRYGSSMVLLNQTNRELVADEFMPTSPKFRLAHKRIVPGSIFFANRVLFKTEVPTEGDVDSIGRFFIDYNEGIVVCYSPPTTNNTVRYQYTKDTFDLTASPIIIHDINNDNFKKQLFDQILLDDGTYENGLPTELGVDILTELMAVVPMYWGI